jgi:imidazolonepropionase-like amidohydrolase
MPPSSTPTPIPSTELLDRLADESMRRPVWIRVGQLIDGASHQPLRDANVVFDAMQVRFVGARENLPHRDLLASSQHQPDAVLADHALLPCLIEAHAHMFLEGAPIDPHQRAAHLKRCAKDMLASARQRWTKLLQCGIGAIRDAGDKDGVGPTLSAEAKQFRGKLSPIPWIDSPGAAIHRRGRYGSFMGQPLEDHSSCATCVAARVANGSDRIKLIVSGIINFKQGKVTTPPQLSVEEVKVLVEASHQHGRQAFAHASGTEGVENSIEGGVNTIEHGFFVTEEQLARMRDRRIGWVPTLSPVQVQIDRAKELGWNDAVVSNLKCIIEGHQGMLLRAYEIGVRIIAGSDAGSCGVPHGIGLLQELERMQHAGIPAMAVIQSATSVGSELLDFPEPIGRIAPGYRSRFILTQHDPLATVANLQNPKSVLFDGKMIHKDGEVVLGGL